MNMPMIAMIPTELIAIKMVISFTGMVNWAPAL